MCHQRRSPRATGFQAISQNLNLTFLCKIKMRNHIVIRITLANLLFLFNKIDGFSFAQLIFINDNDAYGVPMTRRTLRKRDFRIRLTRQHCKTRCITILFTCFHAHMHAFCSTTSSSRPAIWQWFFSGFSYFFFFFLSVCSHSLIGTAK